MALVHVDCEPCTTVALPHAPASVPQARRQMVSELLEYGVPHEVIVDAELVLGELAANAIEHGRPLDGATTFEMTWCLVGSLLRISVIDGGEAAELAPQELDAETLRGRGLQLVTTICDRWRAELHPGTRVTAEMRI